MPRVRAHCDRAVSDIVGTVLMLAVTVSLVGVVALNLNATSLEAQRPIHLEVSATAETDRVTLLHLGGATLVPADLRVVIASGGAILHTTSAGPTGTTWAMGQRLAISVPTPMPAGAIEITLVHTGRGEVIATTGAHVGATTAPAPSPGFTVSVLLDGSSSPPTVTAPSQVLAEASVAHDEGRKHVRIVYADLTGIDGPRWSAFRDDGTRGDRVAGDGIWSAVVNVPASVTPGSHSIDIIAVDLDGASRTQSATIVVV